MLARFRPRMLSTFAFALLACLVGRAPAVFAQDSQGAWSPLTYPAGNPSLAGSAAVYDPVRDRMLVVLRNSQVWSFDLGGTRTWSVVVTAGTAPPPLSGSGINRPDFSLIYDSLRDRLVLFGGGARYDTWELTLAGAPTWSLIPAVNLPPASADHAAIYDPIRDRMVVFGGWDGASLASMTGQTWQLSFSGTPTWTPLATSGSSPGPHYKHSAVYDPIGDRMVIYGGRIPHTPGTVPFTPNSDWAYSLDLGTLVWTWYSSLPYDGLRARDDHTAIFDAVRRRMVIFGGVRIDD